VVLSVALMPRGWCELALIAGHAMQLKNKLKIC
jgi:hypothetical protein